MIENISYSYMIMNGRNFRKKVIKDCDFSNTILNNCDFSDTIIINCNFSGAELNNCNFNGAKIRESEFSFTIPHIRKTKFFYTKIKNCIFRNAVILFTDFWINATDTDFSSTKLGRCSFIASDMKNVDFTSCRVRYTYFEDTIFENSGFSKCTIDKHKFVNCHFVSVKSPEILCQEIRPKVS